MIGDARSSDFQLVFHRDASRRPQSKFESNYRGCKGHSAGLHSRLFHWQEEEIGSTLGNWSFRGKTDEQFVILKKSYNFFADCIYLFQFDIVLLCFVFNFDTLNFVQALQSFKLSFHVNGVYSDSIGKELVHNIHGALKVVNLLNNKRKTFWLFNNIKFISW